MTCIPKRSLNGERLGFWHGLRLADGPQDGRDGERTIGGDSVRDLPGALQSLSIGNNVVDETQLVRSLRADVVSSEEHLGRHGVPDLAREPNGGPRHGKQSALDLGDAKDRALPRHPDVGALEDLGSPRPGVSLGRQDDRLRRPKGLQKGAEDDPRILPQPHDPRVVGDAAVQPTDLGQVHAGTEGGPPSRQDADPQLGVRVQTDPGVEQPAQDLGIGRVPLLRAGSA